jgi:hypothetical protein
MLLPNPSLRRLLIEASAAAHIIEQLRTLEQAWDSLLNSTSELALFHEEDLMQPLLEFSGINASLAGAVARSVMQETANIEGRPRPTVRRTQSSPAEGLRPGEANAAASLRRPTSVPIAGGTITRSRPDSTAHTAEGATRLSRMMPEQGSSSDEQSITRAAASRYFNEMFERAGLRSAWDEHVVFTSSMGHIVDATAPSYGAVAFGDATESERGQSVRGSMFSPRETNSDAVQANALSHPTLFGLAAPQTIAPKFAADNTEPGEDRLARMLSPLIERVSRSHRNGLSRRGLASREYVAGERRSSETEDVELSRSIPLTGLRRLAAGATSARGLPARERDRPGIADDEQEIARMNAPPSDFLSGTEGGAFASQLAELLRREALRLGIGAEEA